VTPDGAKLGPDRGEFLVFGAEIRMERIGVDDDESHESPPKDVGESVE
jgi:hypothetical protein